MSVLISPSWGARTVHWSLPIWGVRLCGLLIVLFLIALATGVGHYVVLLTEARELEALREENTALREHYQKILTLETELANLAEELTQLRWLAGLDVYGDPATREEMDDSEEQAPY